MIHIWVSQTFAAKSLKSMTWAICSSHHMILHHLYATDICKAEFNKKVWTSNFNHEAMVHGLVWCARLHGVTPLKERKKTEWWRGARGEKKQTHQIIFRTFSILCRRFNRLRTWCIRTSCPKHSHSITSIQIPERHGHWPVFHFFDFFTSWYP